MSTNVSGWTTLAEQPLVLLHEYVFGPAKANALAVRLPSGKFLLVSAPAGQIDPALQALSAQGEVIAMVAINGAHHLGLPVCRSAFPNAVSYATASARARILKKGKDPGQLEPIEKLVPLLGDKVSVIAADGCKIGDVLVRVQTERGTLLYVGDFIANIPELPKNLLFRLMFKLTDSGPGFKVFGIFFKFFASNKGVLRDFLIREIESHPPAILVPGHGGVVDRPDLAPTLVSMLRSAVRA
jgi:glyoxylase-like metal-dependent hydrolase (beta-lactamase superfamily II)